MKASAEFSAQLRRVFSELAISELVDPDMQRQLSIYVNGTHDPITRDCVADAFGAEAADRWDDLKAAIAAFRDATQ